MALPFKIVADYKILSCLDKLRNGSIFHVNHLSTDTSRTIAICLLVSSVDNL